MSDMLEQCIRQEGETVSERIITECVVRGLAIEQIYTAARQNEATRQILVLLAASIVFFMQAGFAMVCAGSVRQKNVQNMMLKNLLDACCASVTFFAIGYALAFGGSDPTSTMKTFIGTKNFFLYNIDDFSFWTFQFAFSAASTTIVAGAISERCIMSAYVAYSILLTGLVYPVVAHAIWDAQGYLSAKSVQPLFNVGMLDFAGGAVVHVTGGMTALIACAVIGPRRGRFHDEMGRLIDKPKPIQGFSPALQVLGTFILWFGWYSFNSISAILVSLNEKTVVVAGLAATNTILTAGTAAMVSILYNFWLIRRDSPGDSILDIQFAMNGCLAGLVASTSCCALIEPWAAIVIGVLAGFTFVTSHRLLIRYRIDDTIDAIPVHLSCGVLGLVCVGLFSSPTRQNNAYGRAYHSGLFYSWSNGNFDCVLLGTQLLGIGIVLCWVTAVMLPFFTFFNRLEWLRCDAIEELVGLDIVQNGDVVLEALQTRQMNRRNSDTGAGCHEEAAKKRQAKTEQARSSVYAVAQLPPIDDCSSIGYE